jgi:outer membrane immunogenic protein
MRRFFLACLGLCGLAAPVLAADVAVLAPYPPPPLRPLYSWTGCFIGFNIGGGAASQDFTDPYGTFAPPGASLGNHTGHGAVGGGQLGCDYQIGSFVLGLQGVYDLGGMKGSNVQPNNFFLYNKSFVQTLGTLTARVGYTFTPTLLLYARAGAARIHDLYNVSTPDGATLPSATIIGPALAALTVAPGSIVALGSRSNNGWTVGTGFEWAFFGGDWTAFVEYDYMSFGSSRVMLLPVLVPSAPIPIDVTQRANIVLFGINYRFWSAGPGF